MLITQLTKTDGPLVACPTIEEAFSAMYFLTRACKFQVKALSVGKSLREWS